MNSQRGRIVVGYDGSEHSGFAVDWAAQEAAHRGVPLTVVHIVDYLSLIPGTVSDVPWPDQDTGAFTQVAQDGAERARKAAGSIDVAGVGLFGHVTFRLTEVSREAELLVVGTRNHGQVAGAMIGSVAFSVSAHAHCPVIVVRGNSSQPAGPHHPVVVGVDESQSSDVALGYATEVAARTGAPLIVVSAYHPSPLQVWAGMVLNTVQSADQPNLELLGREMATKVVDAALARVRELRPDVTVTDRVLQGSPGGVLAATAHGAGLLVVGSRGHGGFAGLMLGSVSHRVIHLAPCPVAVVRASDHMARPRNIGSA